MRHGSAAKNEYRRPKALYERVIEISEHVAANGEILHAMNRKAPRDTTSPQVTMAPGAMHASRYSAQVLEITAIARGIGFPQISFGAHRRRRQYYRNASSDTFPYN